MQLLRMFYHNINALDIVFPNILFPQEAYLKKKLEPSSVIHHLRETIMASKSLKKVRRPQTLDQDRLITLLDRQGREIHDQDKIIERIEKFYTELYDSEQSTIIHIDPKEYQR